MKPFYFRIAAIVKPYREKLFLSSSFEMIKAMAQVAAVPAMDYWENTEGSAKGKGRGKGKSNKKSKAKEKKEMKRLKDYKNLLEKIEKKESEKKSREERKKKE